MNNYGIPYNLPNYQDNDDEVKERKMWIPINQKTYAEVSDDINPIHRLKPFAKLCGLDDIIVHGMWTSAASLRLLENPIKVASVKFLNPLYNRGKLLSKMSKTGSLRDMNVYKITSFQVKPKQEVARDILNFIIKKQYA